MVTYCENFGGFKLTNFDYGAAPYPIREDIPEAYRTYWSQLAAPGTWWTGAERVAIAEESRNALTCAYCAARKEALSPYTFPGEHTHSGKLPEVVVDAVHRVVTDQTRITQTYINDNETKGLSKGAYVELVGIVVAVVSIDEFHRALGLPVEELPEPLDGAPSEYIPQHLSEDIGFVPTVPPEGAVGDEEDLWPTGFAANVVRALTLVPNALREWRAIAAAQYIALGEMRGYFKDESRAINRLQMELVAGRVSAVNECFY